MATTPISATPRPPLRNSRFNHLTRSVTNLFVSILAVSATALVILPLIRIFIYLLAKGFSSLNWAFFTQQPKPVGLPGGGMENAIVGSAVLLLIASVIGVPIGVGAGIFLAEFGRGSKLANAVRFTADVLNGVPSIVMGIAISALIVLPQRHYSALAGGVALGVMMIPTITRPGPAAVALRFVHHASLSIRWRRHRVHAGLRPRCRGDCPAALHCLRQFHPQC
jgi:phosphate transport system permease protein